MWNEIRNWDTTIGALAALATALIALISVWLIFIQIHRAREVFRQETVRRKKEATLDIYKEWYDEIHEMDSRIRDLYGIDIQKGVKVLLSEEDVEKIYSDKERKPRETILDLLRGLERISLGIEENIYDYEIIMKLSRTQFISFYGVYFNYIQQARRIQPTAYSCYRILVKKLVNEAIDEGVGISKSYCAAMNSIGIDPKLRWNEESYEGEIQR